MSAKAPAPEGRCVFLDRDGVVNRRSVTLVRTPDQLEILPGVPEAAARLTEAGYRLVVVTNQRPVAWGIIDQADLDAIHGEIRAAIEAAGGRVDAMKACTHGHLTECACGKPEPGMLEEAAGELDLVPERCWMVGDKGSDVEAGRRFGARTIWVTGEHFPWERWRSAPEADARVGDLPEAVDVILDRDGSG
jgi:histidinol-phosphate phosphatase family protein